jgi:hypothetical protein
MRGLLRLLLAGTKSKGRLYPKAGNDGRDAKHQEGEQKHIIQWNSLYTWEVPAAL